jgi:hypothetical protein
MCDRLSRVRILSAGRTVFGVSSPGAFFDLVDHHLTPAMADAGFAVIERVDELTSSARPVPLVRARPQWLVRRQWFRRSRLAPLLLARPEPAAERVFRVGYESEEDEKWLTYFPRTQELDAGDWVEELAATHDQSLQDRVVPSAEELEQTLRLLGSVMRPADDA